MNKPLSIVVLYNEGCPATPKTIELVEECLSESGIRADVRKVLVGSRAEADKLRFLGSPTVQIDGVDIDPAVRDAKAFGFM